MNQMDTGTATSLGAPSEDWLILNSLDKIQVYITEVSPDLARQWLATNRDNRTLRATHVAALADDIASGRWKVTHQGICFAASGRLLDGQHRLRGIIKAKRPAILSVFIGWEEDVFGGLDHGTRRNARDDLLKDGRIIDPCTFLAGLLFCTTKRAPATAEIKSVLDIYENDLVKMVAFAGAVARGRTAAGYRAALMIRYHAASDTDKVYLLEQWRAFVNLDISNMSKSTGALLRRTESVGSDKGSTSALERAAIAWLAFDPKEREKTKIIIRDIAETMADIRAVASRQMRIAS